MNYWNESVDTLIDALKKENLWRAYVITDPKTGEVQASHPVMQTVADAIGADWVLALRTWDTNSRRSVARALGTKHPIGRPRCEARGWWQR